MKKMMFGALCAALVLTSIVSCKKKDKTTTTTPTPATQFTDSRDNQTYPLVVIGSQTWMAANLNYNASGSLCYNASADSCAKYGKLYDGATAQTVCPSGYHLPTDAEWKTLEMFLGMSQADADAEGSTPRGTGEATKLLVGGSSGFNAKYSGANNGSDVGVGVSSAFWTSTSASNNYYIRAISNSTTGIYREQYLSTNMYICVRCLKN